MSALQVRVSKSLPGSLRVRVPRGYLWGVAVLIQVGLIPVLGGPPQNGSRLVSQGPVTPPPEVRRAREGTVLVDQVGHFEVVGDRLVFIVGPQGARLVALENLSLERIARTVASYPGRLEWKVTGVVTEFRGANFILVERAILKSESSS